MPFFWKEVLVSHQVREQVTALDHRARWRALAWCPLSTSLNQEDQCITQTKTNNSPLHLVAVGASLEKVIIVLNLPAAFVSRSFSSFALVPSVWFRNTIQITPEAGVVEKGDK